MRSSEWSLHPEGAETTQHYAIAASQRVGDLVEDRRHDQFDFSHLQMRVVGGDVRDEF
jgi:hypothetical protein